MKLSKEQAMTTFRIFDIKKFAVHDGSGIRTTLFFKGCPLRCLWCQNPEGLETKRRPIYFQNKCIHCMRCAAFSKENEVIYENNRPVFNLKCNDFNHIIKACPSNAIQYDSQDYTIEELLKIILEDQVFYRNNGGVTFSGGEPLMQGEKLIELLQLCKHEKIHTAIETTVYAPLSLIKEALPYLDIVYIDLKIFDDENHQRYTGVSNRIIKDNIQYILKSEHRNKVIIRTPLIPSISANEENIHEIAAFISGIYEDVDYELLNYNPLASSKYELVDKVFTLFEAKPLTKKELQQLYRTAKNAGIKNLMNEQE